MFARSLGATLRRQAPAQASRRSNSSIPSTLYNNVWRKSNVLYITYIVAGCVVIEGIYGSFTSMIWDSYNSGKLYKQIDWTKFKSEDDDEEEE
ncbi:hypothetical protein B484DRAFT_409113 [Ochromonadaceae sp. CCMP2298]|nr:hypothetical protein B484DRAFT_409113 [Ochromonadaceae sp. CCMP2298]